MEGNVQQGNPMNTKAGQILCPLHAVNISSAVFQSKKHINNNFVRNLHQDGSNLLSGEYS